MPLTTTNSILGTLLTRQKLREINEEPVQTSVETLSMDVITNPKTFKDPVNLLKRKEPRRGSILKPSPTAEFESNQMLDHSNLRLENDDIAMKMLQKRSITDSDIFDEEAEKERQQRMYSMLRSSTKYKHLQVEKANSLSSSSSFLVLPGLDDFEMAETGSPLASSVKSKQSEDSGSDGVLGWANTKFETVPDIPLKYGSFGGDQFDLMSLSNLSARIIFLKPKFNNRIFETLSTIDKFRVLKPMEKTFCVVNESEDAFIGRFIEIAIHLEILFDPQGTLRKVYEEAGLIKPLNKYQELTERRLRVQFDDNTSIIPCCGRTTPHSHKPKKTAGLNNIFQLFRQKSGWNK